jgi:hypothetical protein
MVMRLSWARSTFCAHLAPGQLVLALLSGQRCLRGGGGHRLTLLILDVQRQAEFIELSLCGIAAAVTAAAPDPAAVALGLASSRSIPVCLPRRAVGVAVGIAIALSRTHYWAAPLTIVGFSGLLD